MHIHRCRFFGGILATLVLTWVALPFTWASITIDTTELLERNRVGRTLFTYTYRVTATNNSPVDLANVVAYLAQNTSDSAPGGVFEFINPAVVHQPNNATGTTILDSVVELGDIAAGETVVSTDVFVLRQDRQFALDVESLEWEIGYTGSVTLSGLVTDQPISFAEVELTLDRSESGRPIIESGRPIIESYTTTADEDGFYRVDVDFVTDKDFVTINGDGVNNPDNNLDFVELISIAGSAGSLLDEATLTNRRGPGLAPISISGLDANQLNVTHVSTALAALATEANDGEGFTNDEDLAAAQAQVDNDDLLIAAAVLKTVIDNEDVDLPAGVDTTLDLLDDPDEFDDFLEMLEEDFPEQLEEAINETIEDIAVGYVAEDVPETLYLAIVRENPLITGAHEFTFDQDGSGTHVGFVGETTDADWIVDESGDIIVTLNNPPFREFSDFREVPPGSGDEPELVLVREFITEYQIRRLAVGVETDQVLLGSSGVLTFPENATELPDEPFVNEVGPDTGRLAIGADALLPYTFDELSGQVRALTYLHEDNNSVGLVSTFAGADRLTFNADGSGITERREFSFTWSIDGAGRLLLTFDNGDTNEYVRYTKLDGDVIDRGVLIGRYGEAAAARDVLVVVPDAGLSTFSEIDLLERKFRSGAFIIDDGTYFSGGASADQTQRFDFNFLPGGEGCRDSGSLAPFDWSISSAGFMELQRFFFFDEEPELFRQRSWQPAAIVPGVLGTRYWLIENLDTEFENPDFPTDPAATPGRVNFYEVLRDISGNTAPTAVDDYVFTETDTPVFIPLLENDTDAEGDFVLLQGASGTTEGGTIEFSVDPSGTFLDGIIYTPPAEVSGIEDSFTYTVADSSCAEGPADAGTVFITVGSPKK